jgi:hypothetical protein
MNEVVGRRLQKAKEGKADHNQEEDGVDLLALLMESSQDVDDLSGMCVNILLAGRESLIDSFYFDTV